MASEPSEPSEPIVHVVDDDFFAALPYLVANRASDGELAARLQPEANGITNGQGDPLLFGHAGNCGEPQSRDLTDHLEEVWHGIDGRNTFEVVLVHPKRLVHPP